MNDLEKTQNLPANWEVVGLGDICKTTSGGTPSRRNPEYYDGNIPWVKSGELPDGPVVEIEECISGKAVSDSSAKVFPAGTLLVAMYGATVGKLGILKCDAATNQAICAIFPPEEVETKFLFWFLRSVREELISQAIGGAQPNISQGILREIKVPLAPRNEQTRIVAEIEKQFSRLDQAVANLKRVKANLKRYKAAILKAAVEGKLTEEWRQQHPEVEPADKLLVRILAERRRRAGKGKYKEPVAPETANLPELPAGWVWASVEQISVLAQYGSSAKTSEDATGIPVLRMGNIVEGVLNWDVLKYLPGDHDEFPALFLKAGDLLFNRTNSPELVGKTAVYTGTKDPCSFASYLIRVRSSTLYLSPLLAHYINSSYGRQWVKSVVTQQVGQANVNGTKLQALAVPVPPLDEQHQIVAEVERRLSIVAGVEAQVVANLRRADRLRQSILKQAFSGQLVPQDPNDEPASVLLERIRKGVGAIHESPAVAPRKQKRAIHESPLRKPRSQTESAPAASDKFACLDDVTAAILGLMQTGREYARAELADALGLSPGRWNAAIQDLKRRGQVRQVGEKRGARYLFLSIY